MESHGFPMGNPWGISIRAPTPAISGYAPAHVPMAGDATGREHMKNNRGATLVASMGATAWQAFQNYQNRMWFKKVSE